MVDARLFNSTLYVVTSSSIIMNIQMEKNPEELITFNGHSIPYYNIHVQNDTIPTERAIIHAYDLRSSNYTVFGLMTGNIERIFMSYDNLCLIEEHPPYRILLEKAVQTNNIDIEINKSESLLEILVKLEKTLGSEETSKIISSIPRIAFMQTNTTVLRFNIKGLEFKYAGKITVPGRLLDPLFSIWEDNNYLYLAATTTIKQVTTFFVVNMTDIKIVANISGIEPGETLRAARFYGKIGILVTFRRTDPFIVIDLPDPLHPEIKGILKIPGYNEYLHSLSDTIILSIGVGERG